MDKIFITKLALKNLWSHKLRTVLTLTGMIIGISAVVFLISFGTGIQRLVTAQVSSGDAYSLIDVGTGNSRVVKLNDDMLQKVSNVSGVEQIETVTNFGGKAKIGEQISDIAVLGVSSGTFLDWSGIKISLGSNIPSGQDGLSKAVINSTYAELLNKESPESLIGQKIDFDLILPRELFATDVAQTFPDKQFEVVGIIQDDAAASLYANLMNFSSVESTSYSQFKLMANGRDKETIDAVRGKVEAYGLKTEYAGDIVSQVQQFFNVFQIILGSFGLIALVVALLGMFNTLTISLLERIKEVALMEIFGMGRKDIRNLFLTEAITLGLAGGILGIIWGIVLGKIANYILNVFAQQAGGKAVEIFYFAPLFLFGTLIAAVLVGFLTGVYPAIRASKIKPLDVLRYE